MESDESEELDLFGTFEDDSDEEAAMKQDNVVLLDLLGTHCLDLQLLQACVTTMQRIASAASESSSFKKAVFKSAEFRSFRYVCLN